MALLFLQIQICPLPQYGKSKMDKIPSVLATIILQPILVKISAYPPT